MMENTTQNMSRFCVSGHGSAAGTHTSLAAVITTLLFTFLLFSDVDLQVVWKGLTDGMEAFFGLLDAVSWC